MAVTVIIVSCFCAETLIDNIIDIMILVNEIMFFMTLGLVLFNGKNEIILDGLCFKVVSFLFQAPMVYN